MSDFNNFKKQTVDPFRSNVGQGVGGTYGDRMKYQKIHQISSTPPPQVHRDQFKRNAREIQSIDQFGPNADYKAQRHQSKVYKPYALDGFENGTISKVRENAVKPDDPALINFLDRVINSQAPKKP